MFLREGEATLGTDIVINCNPKRHSLTDSRHSKASCACKSHVECETQCVKLAALLGDKMCGEKQRPELSIETPSRFEKTMAIVAAHNVMP
jgi:hypothetical protein